MRTDERAWPDLDDRGLAFGPYGLFANVSFTNVDRPFHREGSGGVSIESGRLRIEELLSAIGRVVDARPGDVLGGFRSSHGHDLGPILMTERGPRILHSSGDTERQEHESCWSDAPRRDAEPLRSIPAGLIRFRPHEDDNEWTCSVDLPALRAHAAGTTIEATAPRRLA